MYVCRVYFYLIASRIPPGPGGSIARNNDNDYHFQTISSRYHFQTICPRYWGHWKASWTPLGCFRDTSVGVWEASGRRLWGSWGHLGRLGGQDALKKSQGRPRSPPKTSPRGPRWPPRASERRPQRPPRGPKRPQKHNKSNITSENSKNLKNDDPLNKNQ